MRALLSRLPLCRPPNSFRLRRLWVSPAGLGKARNYYSTPSNSHPATKSKLMLDILPELPAAPRYPCPFLAATDIETYVLPLYRFGWGVSRVPINTSDSMTAPPATQFSRRIILPNTDIAARFVEDIAGTIVKPENHHPTVERQSQGAMSAVDIHVHTHTARAPPDCQNADDQEKFTRKRPGITLRDIRFAILVERLLLNYTHGRSLDAPSSAFYPQPTDIDTLHNFRVPSPEDQELAEK